MSVFQVVVVGCLGVIVWLSLLLSLIYNFYCKNNKSNPERQRMGGASIFYVTNGVLSWIIWILYALCKYGAKSPFYGNNLDHMTQYTYILYVISAGIYLCSFYIFILLRLKLLFKRSKYVIKSSYVLIIKCVVILNLFLYYSMLTSAVILYYSNFTYYTIVYDFAQIYMYYPFIIVDALSRLLIIGIFNSRLFTITSHQNKRNIAGSPSIHQKIGSKLISLVIKHCLLFTILITLNFVHVSLGYIEEIDNTLFIYTLFINTCFEALSVYLGFTFTEKYYHSCCKYTQSLCLFYCQELVPVVRGEKQQKIGKNTFDRVDMNKSVPISILKSESEIEPERQAIETHDEDDDAVVPGNNRPRTRKSVAPPASLGTLVCDQVLSLKEDDEDAARNFDYPLFEEPSVTHRQTYTKLEKC
eukprot:658894_1